MEHLKIGQGCGIGTQISKIKNIQQKNIGIK